MTMTQAAGVPAEAAARRVLEIEGLTAAYGAVKVLRGLDLHVGESEVVVVLGANGAGKTTTLRAICNMPIVTRTGTVRVYGADVSGSSTAELVRKGVAHVPQGRGTFTELSVEDNLEAGAFVRPRGDRSIRADIDRWYSIFPRLGERRRQIAGSLSGGEQQMLAIARAMMSRPQVLLLDEPSLGLAPIVVQSLFSTLGKLSRDEGLTMLIVEQNANIALSIADRGYILETGAITTVGTAADLKNDEEVRRAYLGI